MTCTGPVPNPLNSSSLYFTAAFPGLGWEEEIESYPMKEDRLSGTWRSRPELKERFSVGRDLRCTNFTCEKSKSFSQGHRACKCSVQLHH